jgi:outer membrane receptor for ferrienterochelin and colicins
MPPHSRRWRRKRHKRAALRFFSGLPVMRFPDSLLRLAAASPLVFYAFAAIAAQGDDAAAGNGERQEAPAGKQETPRVEIRATRSYDERREDTATKIVVTRDEIERYGDSTLAEVLKRLPGITIGGVQGRGGAIRMRGLGNGYTQVMLNGEPAPPGFSLDAISPDLVERIEIMRAATAEYSTQAIAGAINIVLKREVRTTQRELKLGMAHDRAGVSPSVNLQLADRAGALSYSVAAGLMQNEFDRPSHTQEAQRDAQGATTLLRETDQAGRGRFRGLHLSPRLNWNLAGGDTLTWQSFINLHRSSSRSEEDTTTLTGAPPMFSASDTQSDSRSTMLRTNLQWVRKLSADAKLDMKFGMNYNRRSTDSAFAGFDASGARLVDREVGAGATDKGVTASGKLVTQVVEDHALAFGWDGGYNRRGEDRLQNEVTFNGAAPRNLDEVYDASITRMAFYAQDEWAVTQRWSMYLGLRWEGLDTRSAGNVLDEVRNRSSVWSPVLQTLWKLPDTKNDQIRLALSRTYKAPPTSDLVPRRFIANNNSATSPDTQGNPDLRPELAWGADAAYEHFFSDGGMVSASVFARRIDDVMRRRLSLIDGLWVSMPVNEGQARTHGIELEAKMPLTALMKDAPAIELRVNLARNWSSVDAVPGPGNRLDQQTPFSANLGLDYRLRGMPLTVGGNYSFQTGGLVRLSASQTAYTVPKRALDVYGLWKFNPKAQLRIAVSNVLRLDNVAVSSHTADGSVLEETTTTPTNLVARATLELKF